MPGGVMIARAYERYPGRWQWRGSGLAARSRAELLVVLVQRWPLRFVRRSRLNSRQSKDQGSSHPVSSSGRHGCSWGEAILANLGQYLTDNLLARDQPLHAIFKLDGATLPSRSARGRRFYPNIFLKQNRAVTQSPSPGARV